MNTQRWIRRVKNGWCALTEPHPSLQIVEQRRQAQLLATIILVLSPPAFLSGILPALVSPTPTPLYANILIITSAVVIAVLPLYLIARTPFYQVGTGIMIAVASIAIYGSVFINQSMHENPLQYLIIPILLCNLFFNVKVTISLILGISLAILTLPAFIPNIAFVELVIGPLRFMVLISPLLLLFGWYRRQLEQDRRAALAQSEHRYRVVSELTSDFTYSLSITPDGKTAPEWVSGDFASVTGGYRLQGITEYNWMEYVHPDDLSIVGQGIVDLMAGKTIEGELRLVTKDGGIHWIRYYSRPQWNETEQRVTHIYGAAKDISDHKASEAAERDQRTLAEALRDTAAILNSSLEPEKVLDQILVNVARVVPHDAGTIMMIENGLCRVVRHQSFLDPEHETEVYNLRLTVDDAVTLRTMYQSQRPLLIADVRTFESWVDIKTHQWIRAFVGTPILMADEVVGFLTLDSATLGGFTPEHLNRLEVFANQASVAIRNARLYESLAKQAADLDQRVVERTMELDRQRSQLQAILDAMGEGMFYSEGDVIVFTNPALSRITGYPSEEIIGQSIRLFGVPGDTENDHKITMLYDQLPRLRIWRDDIKMRCKNGMISDMALTVTLASASGENPPCAVAVVRDVSQEKALQAQKRQFVANASHELRTPITNIKTSLYLARHQPDRASEHLNVIDDVIKEMQSLTEDLLDLARLENNRIRLVFTSVLLQDLIHDVVRMNQPGWEVKPIHLKLDLPANPITVMADSRRLKQVITNLLANAFNYTPQGGYVTLQLQVENECAVITIADSGVGIAPEHLPHLFDPFFRANENSNGTGLGLSITREIVHLHNGEISVESELGHGSRFIVRIPLTSGDALSHDNQPL